MTYVLLGLIVVAYVLQLLSRDLVYNLGVQWNPGIAHGQVWRLITAMFLHDQSSLLHLLFNGWALYTIGQEVEAYYGSTRFAVIYLLSGIGGGILYYLSLDQTPSLGASGAIFGIIGAEIAYFLRNRRLFGKVSRQQLGNLAMLVVINLILGFTIPGINNLAHLGGLATGFLLGLGLAPRYEISWEDYVPRAVSRAPVLTFWLTVAAISVLLWAGLSVGTQRWNAYLQQHTSMPQPVVIDVVSGWGEG